MEWKRAAAIFPATALCVVVLAGCGSELKKAQANVNKIADLLPGHYTNSLQAAADAKAGGEKHERKSIDIVRLDLPLLSHYAFYAQETSLEEMGHIVSQRLYTFAPLEDGTVLQRVFTFAQPARWRDGLNNPSVFTGMMFKDTTPMTGCELIWKKDEKEDKFTASSSRETCRSTSASVGALRTEMKVELSGDSLALAELGYTAGGKLVQGNAEEPFYRFERGGQ